MTFYTILMINAFFPALLMSISVKKIASIGGILLFLLPVFAALVTTELYSHRQLQLMGTNFSFGGYLLSILIAMLVTGSVTWVVRQIRKNLDADHPKLPILNFTVPIDDKIKLISSVSLVIIIITLAMGTARDVGMQWVTDNFYSAWTQDVVFFFLMGITVVIVTMREPQNENFANRLTYLFPELKGDALENIAEEVKRTGYIASSVERTVIVKKYSKKHKAYLIHVRVLTVLKNVFKDQDAKAKLTFALVPDDFPDAPPPIPLGSITSIRIGNERDRLRQPKKLTTKKGWAKSEEFTVGPDGLEVVFEYWCWNRLDSKLNYTASRFVEKHKTTIINRIEGGDSANVCLQKYQDDSWHDDLLGFGEQKVVCIGYNLPRGHKVPLLRLTNPSYVEKSEKNVTRSNKAVLPLKKPATH